MDIKDLEKTLEEYNKQIEKLRKIENKTLEQQAEKLLLQEEIQDIINRIHMLEEINVDIYQTSNKSKQFLTLFSILVVFVKLSELYSW